MRSPEARGRSQNRARSSEAVFAYLHILSYTYIHVHIPTSTYIYLQQSEIDQRRDKMHRRPKNTTANRKTPQQTERDQIRTKNTIADRKTQQQTEKHHSKPKLIRPERKTPQQTENTTVYICILQTRIRTTALPVHCLDRFQNLAPHRGWEAHFRYFRFPLLTSLSGFIPDPFWTLL